MALLPGLHFYPDPHLTVPQPSILLPLLLVLMTPGSLLPQGGSKVKEGHGHSCSLGLMQWFQLRRTRVLHMGVNVSPGNLQRPVAPPGSSPENVFKSLACDPGHSAAAVLVGPGSERPQGVLEGSSLVTNSSAGLNYPCC